jgi:hypothetical protein
MPGAGHHESNITLASTASQVVGRIGNPSTMNSARPLPERESRSAACYYRSGTLPIGNTALTTKERRC